MPFVKIHVSSSVPLDTISLLAQDVRVALVDVLEIQENIGQVMVYQISPECRSTHSSRDKNFVFIEITMYPGRSAQMKRNLMEKVNLLVNNYLGVDMKDINCCIIEVLAENWGGGVSHKYIEELS